MHVKASLFPLLLIITLLAFTNPAIGQEEAPDFTLVDIYGQEFSLSDYRGRVVLIDLFRLQPSCPPCISEIQHLKGVYTKYSTSDVIIMSISVSSLDTDEGLRSGFVEEYVIPWIVACGGTEIASKYSVSAVPTLVIVDAEGNVRYRHEGVTAESTLSSEIDFLLSETGNGDSNGDSNTTQPEPSPNDSGTEQNGSPYTLIAVIVVAAIVVLVVGVVVAGQLLGWSEPAKKRRSRKGKR